jgi:hypothetical protein
MGFILDKEFPGIDLGKSHKLELHFRYISDPQAEDMVFQGIDL